MKGNRRAAQRIHTQLGAFAPYLVAITGNPGRLASMDTALAFDRVIAKPVDVDLLLDLVAEV